MAVSVSYITFVKAWFAATFTPLGLPVPLLELWIAAGAAHNSTFYSGFMHLWQPHRQGINEPIKFPDLATAEIQTIREVPVG